MLSRKLVVTLSKTAKVLQQLTAQSPSRCILEVNGSHLFYYIIDDYVLYLALVERSFPGDVVYRYLDAVVEAFQQEYAGRIAQMDRPFGAMDFERRLQRIRRSYDDPRNTPSTSLHSVNRNLAQVQQVMRQNVQDLMQRGERLDAIAQKTNQLRDFSKDIKHKSSWMLVRAKYQAYLPYVAVLIVVLIVLYWRLG